MKTSIGVMTLGVVFILASSGCRPQTPVSLAPLDAQLSKARQLCAAYLEKGKEPDDALKDALANTGTEVLDSSGCYVVSEGRERDGVSILELRDADGKYLVKNIFTTAQSLGSQESATIRFDWRIPSKPNPMARIARISSVKDWKWILYTSAYEEDLRGAK